MSGIFLFHVLRNRRSSGNYPESIHYPTYTKPNEYKKIDAVKTGWILLAMLVILIGLCFI